MSATHISHPRGKAIPITYVITALHNEQAGTERHLLRLIRNLDRNRFDPRLVVLQHSAWTERAQDPRVPLTVLGLRSLRRPADWACVVRLARLLRRGGTRITELHSIEAHFVGAVASRLAKVPVVISCRRDLGHLHGRKEILQSKLANRFVTRFLANSRQVVERIGNLEGIDRDRFEVIDNGIDLDAFDREMAATPPPSFRRFIRGKKVVSIVANLFSVKNHEVFLRAARGVADQMEDVVFVIAGDGPLRETLERQALELGLDERVLWLGSVSHVAPYLANTDVACLASRAEGSSNALIEYMAARLPVVATRIGAAPDAISDPANGRLVPPGDAESLTRSLIELLACDTAERQRTGAAARRCVEDRYTLDRQLDAYQRLYLRELAAREHPKADDRKGPQSVASSR